MVLVLSYALQRGRGWEGTRGGGGAGAPGTRGCGQRGLPRPIAPARAPSEVHLPRGPSSVALLGPSPRDSGSGSRDPPPPAPRRDFQT